MKNLNKLLVLGLVFLFSFLLLIIYNQQKAKKAILSSKTPLYKTILINPPSNALANQLVEFIWEIKAPDTATTSTTTIYYSPVSSPSALTIKDSPEAVGYSYHLTDYLNGSFSLPDTFSARNSFLRGTVFYRSYAKVGNQHLWSKELKLSVN